MMKNIVTLVFITVVYLPAMAATEAEEMAFFESKVRPILVEHCYSCHSKDAKKVRGELWLDTKDGWLKGGESGPVIVPGQPEKSLFVDVLSYKGTIQMPPKGKLADKDIAILSEWVKRGAHDPRKGQSKGPVTRKIDFEAAKNYWAWQPLRNPSVPKVMNSNWCKNDIDRFLMHQMEA